MKNKICILGKQSRQDFDELQIQHLSVTLHGLTLANFSQMHGPCLVKGSLVSYSSSQFERHAVNQMKTPEYFRISLRRTRLF